YQNVQTPGAETSTHAPARRTTDDESGAKRRIWSAPEKRRDESRRCRHECLRHRGLAAREFVEDGDRGQGVAVAIEEAATAPASTHRRLPPEQADATEIGRGHHDPIHFLPEFLLA